ncbi:MAG: DUF503 domain-containing protein [Spirochaetales bacterium]|nr:DUF503 domain-containing protein [Spirochaetales bacterium]
MVVSMLQFIIELYGVESIKDKRRMVKSLKDRLYRKYRVSVAEVDLLESLSFTQIGVALVSNSREYGEKVMNKIEDFIEEEVLGRLHDVQIFSEQY